MGQTLTHGIYLPDEGERNCYNGLAANWQLLDGAVGTVAEHTSQIAGKAPAVHTHTVSDITDFPAYGTTAGTICEGNDSRLSDARTPVAHTHGKADITDLFNSANTWTQSQTIKNTEYQIGEIPSATKSTYINFTDKNNVNIGWLQRRLETSGDSSIELFVYNRFTNSQPDTAGTTDFAMLKVGLKSDQTHFCEIMGDTYPRNNNVYNLGLSTNQWKSVYAQSYYYNGVAWGLDKANVWSAENTYTNTLLTLKHTALEVGVLPASNQTKRFRFTDKNNANLGWLQHRINTSGDSYLEIYAVNKFSNGQFSPQGSDVANSLIVGLHSDGTRYAQIMSDFVPEHTDRNCNLGTSTNKWKSLNGVNPGALSFPSDGTTENTDWFNVAGDILPTGGNATDLTGGQNFFTPPKDGWLCLVVKNCSYISVWDSSNKMGQSLYVPDTTKNQQITLPVLANHSLEIRVIGSSWDSARLIMPKGNV